MAIGTLAFAVLSQPVVASLRGHNEALSTNGPRTGYPGAERAVRYVHEQLAEAGLAEIHSRQLAVPVPLDHGTYVEPLKPDNAWSDRIELHHVWPNVARTSTVPPVSIFGKVGTRSAGTDWDRLAAAGFGGLTAVCLSFLRSVFLCFSFRPTGFVYGTGLGTLFWGSALVGWCVKTIVVRYGGAGTYQRVRPFFVGMIFGELGSRLVWGFLSLLGETGGGYDWW